MNNCDDAISRADLIKHFTKWKDEMAYAFGEEYSGVDVLGNAIQIIKYRPSVQPSRVECEDAISRHKAIVMITAYEGKSAQIEALEQLPSVQPSRKGHWIWVKDYCKCSECGIGMGHTEYDFCPNCGADMRGDT